MVQLIDSHFHSQTMEENGQNMENAWNSIVSGIDIGTTHNDLVYRSELLKNQNHIFLSAAMGPWETKDTGASELDSIFEILKANITKYNPKFIGEIGLDNYCGYGPADLQEYLFIRQLQLADSLGKAVLIHNREADASMASIIRRFAPAKAGIIHCFSGNIEVMKTALDRGFYISYAGNLTFKSNSFLRDTLSYVPMDRLLFETDAPYLAPVPKRGEKNTPEYIIHTYACAAEVLGIPFEKLAETVVENFSSLCSA